jgi:hypothetical protein
MSCIADSARPTFASDCGHGCFAGSTLLEDAPRLFRGIEAGEGGDWVHLDGTSLRSPIDD